MLFSKPEAVPVQVGDQTLNFYPISVKTVMRLRDIAKPIGQALSVLLTSNERDFSTKVVDENLPDTGLRRTTDVGAITPELSKQRQTARQEAIATLVDAILSPASANLLAEMLMDSLRDNFERKKGGPTPTEIAAFLEELTADLLPEMLHGLAEANKKLFAPLKERAASMGAALKAKLAPVPPSEPSEE